MSLISQSPCDPLAQARELKSVYIKARGNFLRLLLHKCYLNDHNLFNQVGLIALNVIGTPTEALADGCVCMCITN